MSELNYLKQKLKQFRRKYYLNRLLRGGIYAIGLGLFIILVVATLEYFGRFNSAVRLGLLIFSLLGIGFLLLRYLFIPLANLLHLGRQISSKKMAALLGKHFPGIDDKVLNTLQLGDYTERDNELVLAAINQKVSELRPVPFLKAISFSDNRKFLPILIVPALLFIGLFLFEGGKEILNSTNRIVRYQEAFIPPAPFSFKLLNEDLIVNAGEDITFQLELLGEKIPNEVVMMSDGEALRMIRREGGNYELTLEDVKGDQELYFEAGPYRSSDYLLKVLPVPIARSVLMQVEAPAYTGFGNKTFNHQADITVPQGSKVNWKVKGENTRDILFATQGKNLPFSKEQFDTTVYKALPYQIFVSNSFQQRPAVVSSVVNVIPDANPQVNARYSLDSTYGDLLFYTLAYNDDYGVSKVERIIERDGEAYRTDKYPAGNSGLSGAINLDTMAGEQGARVSIYFRVWDNDAVNGAKYALSEKYSTQIKSLEEKQGELKKNIKSYSGKSEEFRQERTELDKSIEELRKELMAKKNLDWEAKDKLSDLLKNLEDIEKKEKKAKEELKKNLEKLEKRDTTNDALEEKIKELSEEEKELQKLKEEIQKLMQELDKEKLQQKLDELQKENKEDMRQEQRMDKMLEDLMFQRDLLQKAKDLEDISKELDELSEEASKEEQSKQEELKDKLDKVQEDLEDMKGKSPELDKAMESEKFKESAENAESEMKEAGQKMEQDNQEGANENQKKAAESTQEMSEQLQQSMMQMQANAMQQNMESLRQILENLEIYSHGVEETGEEIMELEQGDPRYREMLRQQNRLTQGAKVIEDSLRVLSERAPQVKEKVFEELDKMKTSLEEAKGFLQEQQTARSAGKHQFSMMAANELALLLDESMQNMMQMMAMQMKGNQNCNKPGGSKPKPGEMGQKMQQLGQKVEKLKRGTKPGEGQMGTNGKGMVEIISEQEQLRQQLKEMAEKAGEGENGNLAKALEEMNKIEEDLLNNNLDDNFVERYKRIETRLLESEKALMERKQKEQREAETGDDLIMRYQKALEQYLRENSISEEALKLNPVYLAPFYKERVNAPQP